MSLSHMDFIARRRPELQFKVPYFANKSSNASRHRTERGILVWVESSTRSANFSWSI